MTPYAAMPVPAILDRAEALVRRLRERLVEIPADPDHHGEIFEADAEELAELAAYISEQAADICLDRMREQPTVEDGPLPAPVCDYFEGRSVEDAMTRDPDPINLFVRQAS